MRTQKDYPLQSLSKQELSQIEGGIIPIPLLPFIIATLLGGSNND